MFLDGVKSGYRGVTQYAQGSFLALFCNKPTTREIRALVRFVKMQQSGHFMVGRIKLRHRVSVELTREFNIFLSGTYGGDGLPIDAERFPGLWDLLHPIPEELSEALWKDNSGWNSAGAEGPLIREWAIKNSKQLRVRPR